MADCESWAFNPADPCCGGPKCGKPCWTGDNANLWLFAENSNTGLAYVKDPGASRGYWRTAMVVFNSNNVVRFDADGVPTGVGFGRSAYRVFFRCTDLASDLYHYQARFRTAYAPFKPGDGGPWPGPSQLTKGFVSLDDPRFGTLDAPLGDDPWAFGGPSVDFVPPSLEGPWFGDSAVNASRSQNVVVDDASFAALSVSFSLPAPTPVGSTIAIGGQPFTLVAVPAPVLGASTSFGLARLSPTDCCQLWCPACDSYIETFVEVDGRRAESITRVDGGVSWRVTVPNYGTMGRHVRYYPAPPLGVPQGPSSDLVVPAQATFTLTCTEQGLSLRRAVGALAGPGLFVTTGGAAVGMDQVVNSDCGSTFGLAGGGELYRAVGYFNEYWIDADVPTSAEVVVHKVAKFSDPMACGAVPLPRGKNLVLTVDGREFTLTPSGTTWASEPFDPNARYPMIGGPLAGQFVEFKFLVTTSAVTVQVMARGSTTVGATMQIFFPTYTDRFYAGTPNENGSVSTNPLLVVFTSYAGNAAARDALGLNHFTLTR